MTYLQMWATETKWLKYQTGNHHAEHWGVANGAAFTLSAIISPIWPFLETLWVATFAVMLAAWLVEFKFSPNEKKWSRWCDLTQYWMFTPFVALIYGLWLVTIPWLAILIWAYFTTMKLHFERE